MILCVWKYLLKVLQRDPLRSSKQQRLLMTALLQTLLQWLKLAIRLLHAPIVFPVIVIQALMICLGWFLLILWSQAHCFVKLPSLGLLLASCFDGANHVGHCIISQI